MWRDVLPLVGRGDTGVFQTCADRCASACWHDASNGSGNERFQAVVERTISRRTILKGAVAVVSAAGGLTAAPVRRAASADTWQSTHHRGGSDPDAAAVSSLGFTPIEPTDRDDVVVADGYSWRVVARWGDPVVPGAPAWSFDAQTPEAQAQQFGCNCDYTAYFPIDGGAGGPRGLLWVNHEFTSGALMFPGYVPGSPTLDQVDIEMAAHGGSVLEVARGVGSDRSYRAVPSSGFNRRITANTPMIISGPAAGDERLRTTDDPEGTTVLGMLSNCAGGVTPWGTVLTAEENFHGYFANGTQVPDPEAVTRNQRYGLPAQPTNRRWEEYHRRFDLLQEPNEVNRFGYIVEIDPHDPSFVPRKRTAMGRFKHEGAASSLSVDGRLVSYMGDDERLEYLYKFVTAERYDPADRAHALTLLDTGTLYVARFHDDLTGEWVPLTAGEGALAGWTPADVAIATRLAADAVGATAMDRPEDVQRNPVTGSVYAALTNNARRRTADAANPRVNNRNGHVIEMMEDGDDAAATGFTWAIFLLAGDPRDPSTYFAGFPADQVSPISCPDNLEFDQRGNLWIGTDGASGTLLTNDGLYAVPVAGAERGHVQQFLSVPRGAEATGPTFTPDNTGLFLSVQHPGAGGSLAAPMSTWPDGTAVPRAAVIAVWKSARGNPRIGTSPRAPALPPRRGPASVRPDL